MQKKKAGGSDAVKEILSYFARNPDAVDGLEGIARWRLMQMRVQRTVEETREALHWLVERGYLVEWDTPATGALFRLNEAAAEKARQYLEKSMRKRR